MSLQFSTFDTLRSPDGDPHPFAQTGQDLCLTDDLFRFTPPDHPDQGPAGWDDNVAQTNTGTESVWTENESTIEIPGNPIPGAAERESGASRMEDVGASSIGSPSPAATAPVKRPITATNDAQTKRPKVRGPGSRPQSTQHRQGLPTPGSPNLVWEYESGRSDPGGLVIRKGSAAYCVMKMFQELEQHRTEADKRATEAERRATAAEQGKTAAEARASTAEQRANELQAKLKAFKDKHQKVLREAADRLDNEDTTVD